jgi:hypothetical protein
MSTAILSIKAAFRTALAGVLALAVTSAIGCGGGDDDSGGDGGTDTDADAGSDDDAGPDGGDNAFPAEIAWAKRSGAENKDVTADVVALSDSSPIVTGSFNVETVFGEGETTETTFTAESGGVWSDNMTLAWYAADGAFQRAKYAEEGFGQSLAVLPGDDVASAGFFAGSFVLGEGEENETVFDSGIAPQSYVAVHGPDGALLWAREFGCAAVGAAPTNLAVAGGPDGSVYVAGGFPSTLRFAVGEANETVLEPVGDYGDVFLAKYAADGTFLWAHSAGGERRSRIGQIAVDADGSVWITGAYTSTMTFGAGEATETVLEDMDEDPEWTADVFVAKYDTDGASLWAARAGGNDHEEAIGVVASADGSAFVAGFLAGTAVFGEGGENETAITAEGEYDIFIAEYGADGALERVSSLGGGENAFLRSLDRFVDGAMVLVGTFVDSIQITDAAEGHVELTSASGNGVFALKLDAGGGISWATEVEISSADDDSFLPVVSAVGALDGSTYLAGSFEGTCTIGSGDPDEVVLTSAGAVDRFLVKIAP